MLSCLCCHDQGLLHLSFRQLRFKDIVCSHLLVVRHWASNCNAAHRWRVHYLCHAAYRCGRLGSQSTLRLLLVQAQREGARRVGQASAARQVLKLKTQDAFEHDFRANQCSTSITNTQSLPVKASSIMTFAEVGLHNSDNLTLHRS